MEGNGNMNIGLSPCVPKTYQSLRAFWPGARDIPPKEPRGRRIVSVVAVIYCQSEANQRLCSTFITQVLTHLTSLPIFIPAQARLHPQSPHKPSQALHPSIPLLTPQPPSTHSPIQSQLQLPRPPTPNNFPHKLSPLIQRTRVCRRAGANSAVSAPDLASLADGGFRR